MHLALGLRAGRAKDDAEDPDVHAGGSVMKTDSYAGGDKSHKFEQGEQGRIRKLENENRLLREQLRQRNQLIDEIGMFVENRHKHPEKTFQQWLETRKKELNL